GQGSTVRPAHSGRVASVAYAPDGSTLASGGGKEGGPGELFLWDVARETRRYTFTGHAGPVRAVAFSHDGRTLASGALDATAILWDVARAGPRAVCRGHTGAVVALALSPDGKLLVTAAQRHLGAPGSRGEVRRWDATTGKEL